MSQKIQINCDCGEELPQVPEFDIMPMVDMVSIACGGHAGSPAGMRNTLKEARKRNLLIGAHPSYPDRTNFGRASIQMPIAQLMDDIERQISVLLEIAGQEKCTLSFVKAHGALYRDLNQQEDIAESYLDTLDQLFDLQTAVMSMPNSLLLQLAEKRGRKILKEAFIDRRYLNKNELLPRSNPNATIHDPTEALQQLLQLYKENRIHTTTAGWQTLQADCYGIHSDHPNTLAILRHIRSEIAEFHS